MCKADALYPKKLNDFLDAPLRSELESLRTSAKTDIQKEKWEQLMRSFDEFSETFIEK